MKPTVQKLRGIPVTVIHRTEPWVWEWELNPERSNGVLGSTGPTICFVAHPPERKFKEWRKGIRFPEPPPPAVYLDGFKLREEFMELKKEQQFLTFLNKVGRFTPLPQAETKYGWILKELVGCQEMFKELARRSPDTWNTYVQGLMVPKSKVARGIVAAVANAYRHTIEFRWESSPVKEWQGAKSLAFIETTDAVSSILATIELDHLRGAKFGACARPDCHSFYEVTSRHKRKYCTQYCAHLEAQRRVRKKQKRVASKSNAKPRPRRD